MVFGTDRSGQAAPAAANQAKPDLKQAILAKAPHMAPRKTAKAKATNSGGFDLDLDDAQDDLDGDFTRRSA